MSDPDQLLSSVFETTVTDLSGNEVKLEKYKGKHLLIVNIASECKFFRSNIDGLRNLKRKFLNGM